MRIDLQRTIRCTSQSSSSIGRHQHVLDHEKWRETGSKTRINETLTDGRVLGAENAFDERQKLHGKCSPEFFAVSDHCFALFKPGYMRNNL